uniref:Uncharacterized protein n=1 Tax=Arcella intermedia TaxID=1963864 RepID=A0A6B2KXG2_9EUKA
MSNFDEERFKRQVNAALVKIKTILDNNRQPTYPADVPHKYDDKYHLADFITNTAIAAQLNCLEALGLDEKKLRILLKWVTQKRSVTIRLSGVENCDFARETTRKVTSPVERVTEIKGIINATITDKTVTTVTEYFWNFDAQYELWAYPGTDTSEKVVLMGRKGKFELMTTSKHNPKSSTSYIPTHDVNVTWLLQRLNDNLTLNFKIDRNDDRCRTPRRNPDVESAMGYFRTFSSWASNVSSYFTSRLFPTQTNHGLDLSKVNATSLFIPVVPLFEEYSKNLLPASGDSKSLVSVSVHPQLLEGPLIPFGDINAFLAEEKRSFTEKFGELEKMFPDDGKLITLQETVVCVICQHAQHISTHLIDAIEYIESMLYKQLIAAIGKEVTPVDFTNYMKYHARQLFKEEYQPRPFCYAIRRPEHYPEGTVSIEAELADGSLAEPLPTVCSHARAKNPMTFNINAATKIAFTGDRYLHAWVSQEFSGVSGMKLNLIARARQFSCFIMIVGSISSAHAFDPKAAIIIQNKDDLKIPLMLERIPTPKQFRDAIDSLSPEQQRFAKAYRSMQLASTLFGVVVIQIKPQLEKLLRLNDDSLTKEIKLTQDLLKLFIEYQIPSDLLSFDGLEGRPTAEKIERVRGLTTTMFKMIDDQKKGQLADARDAFLYAALDGGLGYGGGSNLPVAYKGYSGYSTRQAGKRFIKGKTSGISTSPIDEAGDVLQTPAEDIDYTKIPMEMDQKFEALDEDGSLHSNIITFGQNWSRKFQKALLAQPSEENLGVNEQLKERNKAFDLLDALTKSGLLPIEHAELHVILGSTHTFDKTLINTVVQDNVNPIEKVERSLLIVATTVHDTGAADLVRAEQIERVSTYSPVLFGLPSLKERKLIEGQI